MKRKILTIGIIASLIAIPITYANQTSDTKSNSPVVTTTVDPEAEPLIIETGAVPEADPVPETATPDQSETTNPQTPTDEQQQPSPEPVVEPTPAPAQPEPVTDISCHSSQLLTGDDDHKYALYWDCLRSDGSTTHTFMGYSNSPNVTASP